MMGLKVIIFSFRNLLMSTNLEECKHNMQAYGYEKIDFKQI